MTFLTLLSVILLPMLPVLMILFSTLSVIRHLICGNNFKFPVMYIHVDMFYIICLLIYFYIKMPVCAKKKFLTCISRKCKPFWQLSQLNDFTTIAIAKLFVHEKLNIPEACSETSQSSKTGICAKIVTN